MTDASGGLPPRPLSPHLQVWRWHVTLLTSILHRVTGVALYVGALITAGWAYALASDEPVYSTYMRLLASPLGRLVLVGLTLSLMFHLATGVRHLVWDTGAGFAKKTADATAVAAIAFAVVATAAVWGIAIATGAVR